TSRKSTMRVGFRLHQSQLKKRGDYGTQEGEGSLCVGAAGDDWIGRAGERSGFWSKFLGGDLRRCARRYGSGGAGSDGYCEAHRERADAYGNHQRERRLSNAVSFGRRL